LSTKDVTYSGDNYSGIVIPESFSGISMRWNIGGNGLIAPNEMIFDVSNTSGTYTTSDFETEYCTVRLIIDGSQERVWKMYISRAISYYGKITCYCEDFIQQHLEGDYPNTPNPKAIWASTDPDETDDYCVPVVLGTAYIPVRSVNTGTERYYVLGASGPTYIVSEVKSPRSWPNSSIWTSASYTMTGSTASGYQLLQPKIDESVDPPGNGLWQSGETFYDMLCKFTRSDTVSLTSPAEWIEYVLEDFGILSSDIDATSFSTAETSYDSDSITFNGGWWQKESRERILTNLLAQCDSYLICRDKVELYRFSKTSVETITNVMLQSFSPAVVIKSIHDAGNVEWASSFNDGQDVLDGKKIVPISSGGSTNNPSSETLKCRFLTGSATNAQKAGILYFQKKYGQTQRFNFSTVLTRLTNSDTLSPGQVVTVNNTLYGGLNDMLLTDMTINPDLKVNFTGVVL
jgi:hypothetical protein